MLRNYFQIAFRTLRKQKFYSSINILGLALGIAAALVIILFARYELTYDQFHAKSEDIHMVYKERVTPTGTQPTYDTWVPLLGQMKQDFPEVKSGSRIFQDNSVPINVGDDSFSEDVYYIDREYFEIFDFKLTKGDQTTPFTTQNSVVLSESMANKLFGDDDPIGKELLLDHQVTYVVSGLIGEYPSNSTVGADIHVLLESHPRYAEIEDNWGGSFIFTYVLLKSGTDPQTLESKFPDFITAVFDEETQRRTNFRLLPLHESYNTFIGDNRDSQILLYIAIGIILIASINFMNLSTARSMERAREIAMRKVMGAAKKQLIFQFLSEAIILTFVALVLAILFAELTLPIVSGLFDMQLGLDYWGNWITIPSILVFGLVLGLLTGSYPAFFLSNFRIIESIKGVVSKNIGGVSLRNGLVIVQFTLSIVLIIGTLMITNQLNFMKTTDLGFNKENLIVIPVSAGEFGDAEEAQLRIETFRNEIARHHQVKSLATSSHVPGRWSQSNTFVRPEGYEGNPLRMRLTYMNADFFDTYEIKLLEGTGFQPDSQGDQRESVVLNRAAMKAFGWEDSQDKMIVIGDRRIAVVGVIEDFNYETLRNEVSPILHFHRTPANGSARYITVRTEGANFQETLDFITAKWEILDAERAFDYFFVDEDMKQMYANEDRLMTLVSIFSVLSIFVSCLGLLGLTSFIVERRKREIGIRKVLGASSVNLSLLISGGFIKLVLIAFLIAAPLSYMLMQIWLEGFAYQVPFSALVYVLALLISGVIAFLTVSLRSLQASLANPVESIRES